MKENDAKRLGIIVSLAFFFLCWIISVFALTIVFVLLFGTPASTNQADNTVMVVISIIGFIATFFYYNGLLSKDKAMVNEKISVYRKS